MSAILVVDGTQEQEPVLLRHDVAKNERHHLSPSQRRNTGGADETDDH